MQNTINYCQLRKYNRARPREMSAAAVKSRLKTVPTTGLNACPLQCSRLPPGIFQEAESHNKIKLVIKYSHRAFFFSPK